MASANGINAGVLVRGMRKSDLKSFTIVSSTLVGRRAGALRRRRIP